jgi:hypothetical protein
MYVIYVVLCMLCYVVLCCDMYVMVCMLCYVCYVMYVMLCMLRYVCYVMYVMLCCLLGVFGIPVFRCVCRSNMLFFALVCFVSCDLATKPMLVTCVYISHSAKIVAHHLAA